MGSRIAEWTLGKSHPSVRQPRAPNFSAAIVSEAAVGVVMQLRMHVAHVNIGLSADVPSQVSLIVGHQPTIALCKWADNYTGISTGDLLARRQGLTS